MPMQRKLLEIGQPATGFRDSAFAKNKELPLHRWVPWIAGFSAAFVDDCLDKYLPTTAKNRAWVLDPFAGVGTTLVQSYTRGLNVIGFEINPYAALASQLKLQAAEISPQCLAESITAFESFMRRRCPDNRLPEGEPHSKPPVGFSGRTELFSPSVERRILFALDFINSVEVPEVRDLFRLAFGSVMVSVSNYSYEPSLTRRSAVGKPRIDDAPVGNLLSQKLRLMLEDVGWLQTKMRGISPIPEVRVISDSIFAAREKLKSTEFVDLVITSPPYLNNYHYPRNTRPQIHWLGFASGRGYNGAGEDKSFGKFWQTVRDLPNVGLSFRFPELLETISTIRRLNTEKAQYGGEGWANYAATYFNDAYRFCRILADLLRPRGAAVIVLGNSIIQGVEVKTDYFFGRIAELCGLRFEESVLLRKKRTGSSIIQSSVRTDKAASETTLYESGIILMK
jgi:hypothetical protein